MDLDGVNGLGRDVVCGAAEELPAQPRVQALVRAVAEDIHLNPLAKPFGQMTGPLIDDRQVLLHLRVPDKAQEDEVGREFGDDRQVRLALARLEQAQVHAAFQDAVVLEARIGRVSITTRPTSCSVSSLFSAS